jgi:hypothetical protein
MIEVRGLAKNFGEVKAVVDVGFHVAFSFRSRSCRFSFDPFPMFCRSPTAWMCCTGRFTAGMQCPTDLT